MWAATEVTSRACWRVLALAMLALLFPVATGCKEEVTGPAPGLRGAGDPTVSPVAPAIACGAQLTTDIVVTGENFSPIAVDIPKAPRAALPTITLTRSSDVDGASASATTITYSGDSDDPQNLDLLSWQSQQQMTFVVNQSVQQPGGDGPIPPGIYGIQVTNPNTNDIEESGSLAIVDKPELSSTEPAILCLAQGERSLALSGMRFFEIDGALPSLQVTDVADPFPITGVDGCTDVALQSTAARFCTDATLTLPANSIEPGYPELRLVNPEPAACVTEEVVNLRIVPPPQLDSVVPPLACIAEATRTFQLVGSGFLDIDGTLPAIEIGGQPFDATSVENCESVETTGRTVRSCTTVTVDVPADALPTGQHDVSVTNPDPAGCSGSALGALTIVAPPTIDSVEPQQICAAGATSETITVQGTGFIVIDAGTASEQPFSVTANGTDVTPTPTGCTELAVAGLAVSSCTGFTFDIDPAQFVGPVDIAVANPDPSGCSVTATAAFSVAPEPTIAAVAPSEICTGDPFSLTITGTGFIDDSAVSVGGSPADSVTVNSDTELVATFDIGFAPGTYDVTIVNSPGCEVTSTAALLVDPLPIVFFVDPPVLYNGITVEVTIFTTNLRDTASAIELIDGSGNVTNIDTFASPIRPNRIQAEIPSGLDPGPYEVRVTSSIGCVGSLPGGIDVTDTLTIDLVSVDPSFASTSEDTAVTINAADPPGAGLVGFEESPVAYLTPSGGGGVATPLRAVVFQDASQVTGIIPEGLQTGTYDLIVVNPSGAVGVLSGAVTVTDVTPTITSITPSSFDQNTSPTATVNGTNFDTTGGVTVSLECRDGSGVVTTPTATVDDLTLTATSVDVLFDFSSTAAGNVCIVTITNVSDGAFFTYSAISVKEAAQNLTPFAEQTASPLPAARRALSLTAGRPTERSRYLYAIGGDDGAEANAFDTIVSVNVDVFGDLGGWDPQRYLLPSARTFAGVARVGAFIYLTGGHDGTSARDTTLRAQVLDPLAGPEVVDLAAGLGDGTNGLGGGQWYYRVSATFPSTDASNPGGESMPSEFFPVRLPDRSEGILLTLFFSEVAGANGYRIYRTPVVNDPAANVQLIGEINCGDMVCTCGVDLDCSFVDDGAAADPSATPLPPGSLGTWHPVSVLKTARDGHATVAAPNPANPSEWYLYAFGGRDTNGNPLSSYEWARVTIAADGSQTVSDWTTGTKGLGVGKVNTAAWVVTRSDTSVIDPGEVFIFTGTGWDGGGNVGAVVSGSLTGASTNGDLTSVDGTNLDLELTFNPARGGAGFGDASGWLYIFGGGEPAGGGTYTLDPTDTSTEVVDDAGDPDLSNANSLAGGSLAIERIYPGSTQESAFFFVAGGADAAGTTLSSVERTVQ